MATKRAKKTDVVSPSSAELRKAVEAIAIQPKSGKITLLTRKLFNVLLAVAQQADESGDTYRALLSDIVANSAFDSNDTALVKEHLRRMVSVQVEWSTGTSSQKPGRKWGISTLIADAEILEDPTTRRVWVEFSFAPKIKKKLLDPVQYARLSLQFQSQLRSSAGLALYEICVRYLTNPSHLTMRETWEWWRPILSGTPDTEAGDEAKREYKYFKRDYLRPAIAEVNAVTNIFVELIEHREGRRVAEIQFRVTERKQPMLALDEHPNVFDSTLVDRMVKIGIPLKEAQTLYADSEENRIRAALQMTEQRMRSTSLPPVRSAPALFKDALKKGYAPPVEALPSVAVARRRWPRQPTTSRPACLASIRRIAARKRARCTTNKVSPSGKSRGSHSRKMNCRDSALTCVTTGAVAGWIRRLSKRHSSIGWLARLGASLPMAICLPSR